MTRISFIKQIWSTSLAQDQVTFAGLPVPRCTCYSSVWCQLGIVGRRMWWCGILGRLDINIYFNKLVLDLVTCAVWRVTTTVMSSLVSCDSAQMSSDNTVRDLFFSTSVLLVHVYLSFYMSVCMTQVCRSKVCLDRLLMVHSWRCYRNSWTVVSVEFWNIYVDIY